MMATFAQTNSTSDFEVQIQVVAVQNCSYSCMKIAQIFQIYPPKVVKPDLRVFLPIVASRRNTLLEKNEIFEAFKISCISCDNRIKTQNIV